MAKKTEAPIVRQETLSTQLVTERPNGTRRVQHVNEQPSETHQSFKDSVDINNIIKRHRDTRQPLPSVQLNYADVSHIGDYRDALDTVDRVSDLFMTLPAMSRAYFENDVGTFLDYAANNGPEELNALLDGPPTGPMNEPAPTEAAAGPPPPEDPPAPAGDS
jgi:hypothetical protein